MKKIALLLVVAITFFISAFTLLSPPEWKLTEEYSIRFKGKRINGFFHKLKGNIAFDEKNLATSSVKLEAEVNSITTGNSLKSWHSKRRKWFDAKNYPTISFESRKFEKAPKGYLVTGKLKMKGVEKEITVPFNFSNNIFFGQFKVKRSDYNVGKVKGFAKLVSDTIVIDFTIPVTK